MESNILAQLKGIDSAITTDLPLLSQVWQDFAQVLPALAHQSVIGERSRNNDRSAGRLPAIEVLNVCCLQNQEISPGLWCRGGLGRGWSRCRRGRWRGRGNDRTLLACRRCRGRRCRCGSGRRRSSRGSSRCRGCCSTAARHQRQPEKHRRNDRPRKSLPSIWSDDAHDCAPYLSSIAVRVNRGLPHAGHDILFFTVSLALSRNI